MRSLVLRIVTAIAVFGAAPAAAEMRLVMVEEDGCVWCQRWHEEIGPIYPKTDEGAAAPLLRVDIHETAASGIAFDRRLSFTPTFVLIKDEAEVSRLEGYPGEDFFWPIVGDMIEAVDQGSEG
jgi:thioredoxin-related protein